MIPINGLPLIEYIINHLKRYGITDIIIAVGRQGRQIRNYCRDGSRFGVKITYSTSRSPLGTAGEVWNAAKLIKDRFLCYYGDILTNIPLDRLIRTHEKSNNLVTIAVKRGYRLLIGIVKIDSDGKVLEIVEKPVLDLDVTFGIFIAEKELLKYVGKHLDFGYDVFPSLIRDKKPIGVCYFNEYEWFDIGTMQQVS